MNMLTFHHILILDKHEKLLNFIKKFREVYIKGRETQQERENEEK